MTQDTPDHPLPRRGLQYWAAFLVALGEFIDGYDLLVMGSAVLFLKPAFHLRASQIGLLGAAAFLGAAVGLLGFGTVADRWGRRRIFLFNLVFFVGFAVLSAFITNTTELFITRFMIGVAVGADIPASTAFLAEIAPAKHRGKFLGVLPNMLWILGAAAATVMALLLMGMGINAWRWMFGIAAIPALLVLLGRQILPESPRWLMQRGQMTEARDAARRLGVAMPESDTPPRPDGSRFRELFSPMYRKRTIVMALVFGLNCLAGPVTTLGVPYILRYGGLMTVQSSLLFSLSVYAVDLLGVFTGFLLIDRWQRRSLAYLSIGGAGTLAVVIGITGFHTGSWLIILYLLLAYTLWSGSALLVWVWASELFPTRIRGTGQGFCNATCRVAIAANTFLVPIGIAGLGIQDVMIAFAVPLYIMLALVASNSVFNTTGKTLEEIAE